MSSKKIIWFAGALFCVLLLLVGFSLWQLVGREGVEQQPSAKVVLHAGDPAPSFVLSDLEGNLVSLEDFRGKLVLLNFWATWCVPCVAEMPALERLKKAVGEDNFEIIAIDADPPEGFAQVERFVRTNSLSYVVLLDPKMKAAESYGLGGFPESFFIGPDGKLLAVYDPSSEAEQVRIESDRPWDSLEYIEVVKGQLDLLSKIDDN